MAKMVLEYDAKFAGAKFVSKNEEAIVTSSVLNSGTTYYVNPGGWVVATGYYYHPEGDTSSVIYFQTTDGQFIIYSALTKGMWDAYQNAVKLPKYSRDDTQRMVDGIIKNNIHIVENNLLCARYADKFTADERKQIVQLQQRVQERMNAITDTGYCENIEKSYPKGYADLEPYLANLMKSEGVGLVWWAWCIVAAFVLGSFATVAYYVYHDLFEQSEEDVKWSDELTRKLQEKLTPEEYEQLKTETQGIVTKAKIQAKVGTWKSAIKVGAILVACALVINLVRE